MVYFYRIEDLPQAIEIGFTGEHNINTIQIDYSSWAEGMEHCYPSVVCVRPGETMEDAYIAATTYEHDVLSWSISSSDLGDTEGTGLAQVWLEDVENASINKSGRSAVFATVVRQSVDGGRVTPPQQAPWLEQMTLLKTQTIIAHDEAINAKIDVDSAMSQLEAAIEAAAGSASDAAGSATSAQGYAGAASASAEAAAASASSVEDSATAAAGSATAAAGSASDAADSATAAAGSATSAYGYQQTTAGYVNTVQTEAAAAQGWATGGSGGTPSATNNSKAYAMDSEAFAVGERGGSPVSDTDETYHNNSKYYCEQAESIIETAIQEATDAAVAEATEDAEDSAEDSEAYAIGKRGGVDVGSSDPAYHNNSKYFSTQAASSATDANTAKTAAQAAQAAAETAAETDLVAWLEQNITNPDSPPLDRTLSSSSAAAPADMVGDLKTAFDDITETVYSTNIFDQANTTVTEGKYLNPSTGNEGTNADYNYINDYIPVKPETDYIGTVWQKSNESLLGYYNYITCFYKEDKTFLSGSNNPASASGKFTTPSNAYYMRFSIGKNAWTNRYVMIEEGETASATYTPYSKTAKLRYPFVIVDASGKGDYTSIKTAIDEATSGSVVFVMAGTYTEQVSAWGKEIHIIGIDREACILRDTSGNYSTPPLEIGAGSIQNMTIIENANGAGSENMSAYAIHIEDNNLYNKKLLIRNCYIESDSSSAIGMGLRGGCSVRIEDCEIVCTGARASTGAAPLYFHDADASAYYGTANLYLHNNILRNTSSSLFSMLTINSIHAENTTYMHLMYNIFVRSKTPSLSTKYNTWNTSGNTSADGWNGLSHMYLEDDSFGNNQTELNYSA